MSENTEPFTESGRGAKSGYVPVTPLGPPPQGEPLLSTQGQVPAAPEAVSVRENGYVGRTPLGPPPQGEPLFAQQAQATAAPSSQAQPQAQAQAQPTVAEAQSTATEQAQLVDLRG